MYRGFARGALVPVNSRRSGYEGRDSAQPPGTKTRWEHDPSQEHAQSYPSLRAALVGRASLVCALVVARSCALGLALRNDLPARRVEKNLNLV